ncbi:hypothetical protein OAB20_05190 [Winogradskyella sp.]|nr:hypothetical protein [Winogradskyella sp.]MDC1504886.1 hypothetical protein [Winogradskyella sp.]
MKKTLIISLTAICVSVMGIIFVKHSNDHKECEIKTEIAFGDNDEKIVSEIYICKEKFNL